ncbi:hypothetical protein [Ktedonobacter robiniae]|uniref:Uncharacterized protein n=1 Tax=Ktedonobacter robiniae TaxID=2778365 RepID=A0ABQ3US36_9CHLR|nr:hypothetical protein [Ktedonobacter robiniae]GHO55501.1 hypothetical protein KSB_39760 [Ktedonobacter robiniae]
MQILRKSERVKYETYAQVYNWLPDDGTEAGFSFPCDKHGNYLLHEMGEEAIENLTKCQDGTYAVKYMGMQTYHHAYTVPATGRCIDCGREVDLACSTNECDCGRLYNLFGQPLTTRRNRSYYDY